MTTADVSWEAAGDHQIGRTGITFSFLTGFPGNLNRFVIERADLDANRSRLYFMRGDCRFELTVSQSVLRDGQWVLLPLAPSRCQRDRRKERRPRMSATSFHTAWTQNGRRGPWSV